MKEETDRQKFIRLANARVPRAIKAIRLIGNLSNRSNYDYGAADARKIVEALDLEVRNLRLRFEAASKLDKPLFKLPT